MAKYAIVLAGCGVFDGAEIHESVGIMTAICKYGSIYKCFSVDKNQHHVINHLTKEPSVGEIRNVLVESSRISRGDISPLHSYSPNDFDALILPGGFGVAKNLFSYAIDGADCNIDIEVQTAIITTHNANKYIGAMCVSPGLVVRAFKGTNIHVTVTAGDEAPLAEAIIKMGGRILPCDPTKAIIDKENKIVSTPCYTSAKNIFEVAQGTEALIKYIEEATS